MSATDDEVFARYQRTVDGHVFLRETIDTFLDAAEARLGKLKGPPRILELGSHGGFITDRILARSPEAQTVVADDNADMVGVSRRRLNTGRVSYHTAPLCDLSGTFDLVVSVARHHHLPHDYLRDIRQVMKPGGMYLVADELCPEYCRAVDADRIARAEVLHIIGGYVLTSRSEVASFESGAIPPHAEEMERRRQKALWRWYRFVVDHAVEHGYFDVARSELQSTLDDLVTGSDAEHKFSPLIVEKEFELAGFRIISKRLIGPAEDPERQSLFVYEYALA